VQAHKKNWVYRDGIDNARYASDENHGEQGCTGCHGGTDGTSDRGAAHAGMLAIPGASTCAGCHSETATLAAGSLHTTLAGYQVILAGRGFDLGAGTESRRRYDLQCTKCHAATAAATPESACGHCHVSVPDTAGGGLVAGHRMSRTPDVVNHCTACHGSRVKDEYFGLNQTLYARNRQYSASLAATDPFGGGPLQPDVHRQQGLGCTACHAGAEMHGQGAPASGDRYAVAGAPQCATCHPTSAPEFTAVALHSSAHVEAMSCHVCHAQPYKSCFSCHTQETASGAAWFASNVSDPTRADRWLAAQPAWAAGTTYALDATVSYDGAGYRSLQAGNLGNVPDEPGSTWWEPYGGEMPGDALMTFRAGRNPKFGVQPGAPEYAVLRHAPVDADTFTYTEEGASMPGLLPDLAALPTWKYATPHNIARTSPITQDPDGGGPLLACDNCHGDNYASFWLTDAVNDAHGWVPSDSTFEVDANGGVRLDAPIPYSSSP
jgi:hypothetical protein